ncbi:hypothetical protein [Streptomyces palmae]|uniref:Uncharacterized protein n=1 Tax=Streptomyces palmae TaxID=1701085 RepID=A0A4Z0GXE4_9ACTN|nr:hypothetical protein [Streptomyces palmae]TGB01789.1 hypothetical protein E4099_20875 [Streptomyces palmae]
MPDQPGPEESAITAQVTVTGGHAVLIRDLAAVLGRTPEALAVEWAAGALTVPAGTVGDSLRPGDWGLFDGAEDLAQRTDEYLSEGFAQRPPLPRTRLRPRAALLR